MAPHDTTGLAEAAIITITIINHHSGAGTTTTATNVTAGFPSRYPYHHISPAQPGKEGYKTGRFSSGPSLETTAK